MNKTQARRAYVQLENARLYYIGTHARRRRRLDWFVLGVWMVILASCLIVLGGVGFLLWQAISAIGRWLGA